MDHEAFGHWLSEELATDRILLQSIIDQIALIQQEKNVSFFHQGNAFQLKLTREDAVISACDIGVSDMDFEFNDSLSDEATELALFENDSDALYLDQQEGRAHCGLEDFNDLIKAWRQFILT